GGRGSLDDAGGPRALRSRDPARARRPPPSRSARSRRAHGRAARGAAAVDRLRGDPQHGARAAGGNRAPPLPCRRRPPRRAPRRRVRLHLGVRRLGRGRQRRGGDVRRRQRLRRSPAGARAGAERRRSSSVTAASVTAAPGAPLRRHSAFVRLWASVTVSVFGDQISALAIPLCAVLTLHASAQEMGLLTALFWLPHLLFALPVGVWVDARPVKRLVMVAADLARAALLVSIPLAFAFDVLTLDQLFVVVFLVGSCAVFFDLAYSSFFTATVPREQVLAANGHL